jgi:hypothetical protein
LVSSTGVLAASLRAGPAVEYKQVAPPPPPLYGVGLYGAIDMGANVYQNRGDDRTFTDDNPNSPFFGSTLDVDPKNDVGSLAASNWVTSLARAGFVRRLKETSSTDTEQSSLPNN